MYGKVMFKQGRWIFLLAFIAISVTSCVEPGNFRTRDRYVVNTGVLLVREAPSTSSKIIGRFKSGDTLVASEQQGYWIMVRKSGISGFVATEYLKPINPMDTPPTLSLLEGLANWKSWEFWVIAIVLVTLWLSSSSWINSIKNKLSVKFDLPVKSLLITPVVLFVNGVLTGLLYIFWKDQVIEGVSKGFQFLPDESNLIDFVIWIQLSLIILSLVIDLLGSIFKDGVSWGIALTFLDLIGSIITFATALFLTVSLSFYAIVFLIVVFATKYIITVYQNSNRKSGYTRPN